MTAVPEATPIRDKTPQRGIALLLVVIFASALAGLMMLMLLQLQRENAAADNYEGIKSASDAADAGLEYAVAKLWDQYLQGLAKGVSPTLSGYRAYLTKALSTGSQDLLGGVVNMKSGAAITAVKVSRSDAADTTTLGLTSIATAHGRERRAIQNFTIGGATFQSFDYALMGGNMECVMCHTVVDNIDRLNNTSSKNYGTFDRVKVGVLERMSIETTNNRSRIAGTLHTRGVLNAMSDMAVTGALSSLKLSGFKANSFNASGKILEDTKGNLSEEYFEFAGTDKSGLPLANGTLYKDYPTTQDSMTDGYLPTSIPAVIQDTNKNRVVDDDEWKAHTSASKAGAISGGVAYGVPEGKTYTGDKLPTESNDAIKYLASGAYNGNVMLVGTDANPITISGDVFVNGDVAITGKVKGTGKIQARRNIYFVGDTTNADAATTFGKAKDGTQNLVGYAAGGNILLGDFLSASATNQNDYGKNKWVEYNREGDKMKKLAYLNPETNDSSPLLDKGDSVSFASQELMKFNQSEYAKLLKDPTYVPRYYALRDTDRAYRFTGTKDARDLLYSSYDMSIMSAEDLKGRALLSLAPGKGWLSDDTLKQFWWNDERARDSESGQHGFKVDGLLYTNNALIGFMPTWSRHKSNKYGSLRLRGAAFATDMGILATGNDGGSSKGFGFNLQYDARVKSLLNVSDNTGLTLKRSVRLFETAAAKK